METAFARPSDRPKSNRFHDLPAGGDISPSLIPIEPPTDAAARRPGEPASIGRRVLKLVRLRAFGCGSTDTEVQRQTLAANQIIAAVARRTLDSSERRAGSFARPTSSSFASQFDVGPTAASEAPIIIVCGLAAEAKIARAPGVIVIQGGGDGRRLEAQLEAVAHGARAIVSFGVAGGLAPGLRPGDARIADIILAPDGRSYETDRAWSAAIARELQVPLATFVGVDTPLGDRAGKAAIYLSTGAAAVDMESHIVARVAARHAIPLAAIRVVTDPAEQALPHAATVGMRSDGKVDLAAILRSLAKNPGQLPGLIRTGLDARAAFASLLRCRQLLGPGFALLDLVEPGLNVP